MHRHAGLHSAPGIRATVQRVLRRIRFGCRGARLAPLRARPAAYGRHGVRAASRAHRARRRARGAGSRALASVGDSPRDAADTAAHVLNDGLPPGAAAICLGNIHIPDLRSYECNFLPPESEITGAQRALDRALARDSLRGSVFGQLAPPSSPRTTPATNTRRTTESDSPSPTPPRSPSSSSTTPSSRRIRPSTRAGPCPSLTIQVDSQTGPVQVQVHSLLILRPARRYQIKPLPPPPLQRPQSNIDI